MPLSGLPSVGFAFQSYDQVWAAMDGGVGDIVRDAIAKAGIVPMKRIWDNGFRQITSSSSRQLNSVDDLKGFKIRVPVTALLTSLFSGLGALPSSISYSELYSALQTHIVEGQENPLAQVSTGKLYEVQKYCALSNHCWSGYWVVGNRGALASLPPDLADILNETGRAVIGTPDMAAAQIERLVRHSGGFGTYLFFGADLAPHQPTLRSYEMVCFYLSGWADLDELTAHLEKLAAAQKPT